MRSYHPKLTTTLLEIPNFPQNLLSALLCLSSASSKACSKTPTNQIPLLTHRVVQWKLKVRVKKTSHVSKLCFMQEHLIFRMRRRRSEHICKVCNGGCWNWRRFARICKIKWLRWWNQDHQAKLMQDSYQGYVHEWICIIILPIFSCILMMYIVWENFNFFRSR